MNGFIAFSKKEITEQLRSFRALILIAVLFLFGMISPLLAKIMPDIFAGMSVQGMTITIPAATALDAYGQFFKNVGQLGLVVLLIIFSGLLSQEVSKGTLIVLLAKGLSRSAVIASKFAVSLLTWTVAYALAAVTAWGYTVYLFGTGDAPHLLFAFFSLWLLGAFLLSLLLLASTAAPGSYGGLLLTAGITIILLILSSFPALSKWSPVALASGGGLLNNTVSVGALMAAVWLTLGLIAAFLVSAILLFRKKKL
jgi:ABC-2 type transport system permease protein